MTQLGLAKPVDFYLGERAFLVEEVLDQWYGPAALFSRCVPMTVIYMLSGLTDPSPRGEGSRESSKSGTEGGLDPQF